MLIQDLVDRRVMGEMPNDDIKPALLIRTEMEWLLGNVQVSRDYQYRIKISFEKIYGTGERHIIMKKV